MLRLSLIFAIVAALAAAGLNFYKVRQVMVDTMAARDSEKAAKVQAQTELASTKETLDKTEKDLAGTKKKLTDTDKALKTANANLAAKEKELASANEDLIKAKAARDSAEQVVEQWRQLKVTPDQVKKVIADLDKTEKERDAALAEGQVFARKLIAAETKLRTLLGPPEAVELPVGLKGKVIAVDPKYDFVVLDIGEDKGVLADGEMLVNRNGKLIGKIRIAAVQSKQCIANVLPQWKKDDIMEGDQVLY